MQRLLILAILLFTICSSGTGQRFMTKSGFAGFYSKTPLEDIEAENKQVYAVIDAGTGKIAVMMLIKGFVFPRELMQEHFNENYAESDLYPKAIFEGGFSGEIPLNKPGDYPVLVSGSLSLHGVTQKMVLPATLELKNGSLDGHIEFTIKPEDFQIRIPSLVRDKIAREIRVRVTLHCMPVN